jgi:phosphohistidine phosphatase SixA
MTKYILLMRHGEHEAAGRTTRSKAERELPRRHKRRLSKRGTKETVEVADRLKSVLLDLRADAELALTIAECWTASTDESRATARNVGRVLGDLLPSEPKILAELNPDSFQPYANREKHTIMASRIVKALDSQVGKNALLIIGHQPFLGWLVHVLTGEGIPLSRSELVCIAFDHTKTGKRDRGGVNWILSPTDSESAREIREKIKSKMDIAKLLSVFITGSLSFLLSSLIDKQRMDSIGDHAWALNTSAVLFFMSIGLYLATMYAYDRLLMPSRFWSDAIPPQNPKRRPKWLVWRPPSSAIWVLYQNMVRIWRYLFMTATAAVILGLFFLAVAVFREPQPILIASCAVVGSITFGVYYHLFKPRIGTED